MQAASNLTCLRSTADTPEARKFVGLEGATDPSTQQQVNTNMRGPDVLAPARFPTSTFVIKQIVKLDKPSQRNLPQYQIIGRLHAARRYPTDSNCCRGGRQRRLDPPPRRLQHAAIAVWHHSVHQGFRCRGRHGSTQCVGRPLDFEAPASGRSANYNAPVNCRSWELRRPAIIATPPRTQRFNHARLPHG